jgi:hypothetical protein
MRFREKALILLVAICVSVLGFNLIASSSVCLLKAARESAYEPIQNYLAKCKAHYEQSEHSNWKTSKFTRSDTRLQSPPSIASQQLEVSDSSSKKTQRINESASIF